VARVRAKGLSESSGIAASRCNPDVLWTHNDSGNENHIFAVTTKGQFLGSWTVTGAKNTDWEDIATYKDKAGKCWLYIGDVGDNKLQRPEHTIFRVPEPTVTAAETAVPNDAPTALAEHLTFSYPDQNNDAETMMIEPHSGDVYVLSKRISGPSGVYRIKPTFGSGSHQKAEAVTQLSVPAVPNGYLTGGDISPDGRRVIICDYTQAYEYDLPTGAGFDEIWKQAPSVISLGKRSGGEAVGYSADGNSIFATSEGKEMPLIQLTRK